MHSGRIGLEKRPLLQWRRRRERVRGFEYHNVFSTRPFFWSLASTHEVNDRLGRRAELSLFERTGLRNPDGSPIKLTTHKLRHWLSTIAARARIEDNQHYDHRTQEERNAEVRALLHPEQATALEKYKDGRPATYRKVGVDRPGVAKVLGVDAVSRHTLMCYEVIQHRFKVRQQELRDGPSRSRATTR